MKITKGMTINYFSFTQNEYEVISNLTNLIESTSHCSKCPLAEVCVGCCVGSLLHNALEHSEIEEEVTK